MYLQNEAARERTKQENERVKQVAQQFSIFDRKKKPAKKFSGTLKLKCHYDLKPFTAFVGTEGTTTATTTTTTTTTSTTSSNPDFVTSMQAHASIISIIFSFHFGI